MGTRLTSRKSAKESSTNSPLLRLPAEIREKIYHYALGDMRIPIGSTGKSKTTIGLPRTCRQIYAETGTMVYQLNVFEFGSDYVNMSNWSDHRPRSQLEAVRAIKVDHWYIIHYHVVRESWRNSPRFPNIERVYLELPRGDSVNSRSCELVKRRIQAEKTNLEVIFETTHES